MQHMLDESWQLLEDFSEAARLRQAKGDRRDDEVLAALCDLAVHLSGAGHASVTSVRQGRFATVAATSRVPIRADVLRNEASQGPCVDAVTQAATSPSRVWWS